MHKYFATSWRLSRNKTLHAILGQKTRYLLPFAKPPINATVFGWGRKKSGLRAAKHKNFTLLEDGFLRGFGANDAALSLVFDGKGVYYDHKTPSHLETLIKQPLKDKKRVRKILEKWRDIGLSKNNDAPEYGGNLPDNYILVVDQVRGDASIKGAGADKNTFSKMLRAALNENAGTDILIKLHPQGDGYFKEKDFKGNNRIKVISQHCSPALLIKNARAIYTVSSQIGFEGLIYGKKVRCFGVPFYAQWGLTQDETSAPSRRCKVSLEQLASAALIKYPKYINPQTNKLCEIEWIIDFIALQKEKSSLFSKGSANVVGFSARKKEILKKFTKLPNFTNKNYDKTILWGAAKAPKTAQQIIRVEDGFIRSKGLGAAFAKPLSWVFDDMGIHYDPSRPSRLENILQASDFDEKTILRAQNLRKTIIDNDITKYNLNGKKWTCAPTKKRVILVTGQVPSDAALLLGANGTLKTDKDLLAAARKDNPSAHIIYKPHPDVVANLRKGQHIAKDLYDEIVKNTDIVQMFTQIDELHTISSLSGFEAILRGVKTVCYGAPFYAGWGLTQDKFPPIAKRKRKLSLDGLVAGALIKYPTYISTKTGMFITPEMAIEEIIAPLVAHANASYSALN